MNFNPSEYQKLQVSETAINGLYEIDLVVNGDHRGWFKENYQKEKLEALGLPSFNIVQNNVSYNEEIGVTRGLHAEPWEKFISVSSGLVFGAWIDLRPGDGFGVVVTLAINPGKAIFVPRGVANGYQTLDSNVTYTYLVNEHWKPGIPYLAVNLFDPELNIAWPINSSSAIISEKDRSNPTLSEVRKQITNG